MIRFLVAIICSFFVRVKVSSGSYGWTIGRTDPSAVFSAGAGVPHRHQQQDVQATSYQAVLNVFETCITPAFP